MGWPVCHIHRDHESRSVINGSFALVADSGRLHRAAAVSQRRAPETDIYVLFLCEP
jgi:hypothetical protein